MDGTILSATTMTRRSLLGTAVQSAAAAYVATAAGPLMIEVIAAGPGGSTADTAEPNVINADSITPIQANTRLFGPASFNMASSPFDYYGTGFLTLDNFKSSFLLNEDESTGVATNKNGYPTAVTAGKRGVKWYINVEGKFGPPGVAQRYVFESNKLDETFVLGGGRFSHVRASLIENGTVRRIEFTVDEATHDGGDRITVSCSLPTPYIADKHWNRCYRIDREAALKAGEIWTEHTLSRVAVAAGLRMMDWFPANADRVFKWDDRPTLNAAAWSSGVPLEAMIDLCNRANKHIWLTIPAQIGVTEILTRDSGSNPLGRPMPLSLRDDITIAYEYVEHVASMIKQQLKPDLLCNVELNNEHWNYQFPQYYYLRSFLPDPYPAGADYVKAWVQQGIRSMRIFGHMMKFADYNPRFIPVWCTQIVNTDVTDFNALGMKKAIADWADKNNSHYNPELAARFSEPGKLFVGGLGLTFYFNGKIATPDTNAADKVTVLGWARARDNSGYDAALRQLEHGDVLSGGNQNSFTNYVNYVAPQALIADKYQVPLFCYEGNIEVPAAGANRDIGFSGSDAVEVRAFIVRLFNYSGMRGLMTRGLNLVRAAGIYNCDILADIGNEGDTYATQVGAYALLSPRMLGIRDFVANPGPGKPLTATLETTGAYVVGGNPVTRITTRGGVGLKHIEIKGLADGRIWDGFRTISGQLTSSQMRPLVIRIRDDANGDITLTETQDVRAPGTVNRLLHFISTNT